MVKILRDEPSSSDAFGKGNDGDGPHARIAAAIERRILSEEGGGTIGLEGDYGSGKSTIVRLLADKLAKRKGVSLIVFDAWSHEGDPLRRAFLETLINELTESCDGLIPEKWLEEKERLAQRHRRSTEVKKSSPSGFGIWIAVATAFVPVGLVVARAEATKPGFLFDWPHLVAWPMWLGVPLLMAPIVVASLRLSALLVGYIMRKVVGWIPKGRGNRIKRWTYKSRKASPHRLKACFRTQNFNFLAQQGTLETESDAYESSDPTSIEFEKRFSDLISDAIEGTDNRIVLVVDNLDRLGATQSLSVWSNLQTFVSQRLLDGNGWSNQFALLVPYTPTAIEKLWDEAGAVTSAESFFEKTFQVRYVTPPPTLSNWQGHLRTMLRESIPEMQPNDKERVFEMFELIRQERAERIVPRQLKLHVNSLAVLWDMWNRDGIKIPAPQLAYAVLHKADRSHFEECLRRRIEQLPNGNGSDKDCPVFPSEGAMQICGPKLIDSLAAIHFNVEPQDAIQLLLEDEVESSLQAGELEKLVDQRERHTEAFWIVLRRLVRRKVKEQTPESLSTWAKGLEFLAEQDLPAEATRIREYVRNQISSPKTAWHPLNADTIRGLTSWIKLDPSEEMRDVIVEVGQRTTRSTKQEIKLDAKLDLVDAFRAASVSPKNEQRPETWKVEMDASEWLNNAAERCVDEEGFVFVEPMCSAKSIVEELSRRARAFDDAGNLELDCDDIAAFENLRAVSGRVDGTEICEAVVETMTAKAGEQTKVAVDIVSTCVDLLHALRLLGEEFADNYLNEDSSALLLLTTWTNANAVGASTTTLAASLILTHPKVNLSKDFAAVPEPTRNKLKAIRTNGGMKTTKPIWRKLREYDCRNIAGKLARSSASTFIGDMVEAAAQDGDASLAMSASFGRQNANWLVQQFEDRDTEIELVVSHLEQNGKLLQQLTASGDPIEKKDRECAGMFLNYSGAAARDSVAASFGKKCEKLRKSSGKKT